MSDPWGCGAERAVGSGRGGGVFGAEGKGGGDDAVIGVLGGRLGEGNGGRRDFWVGEKRERSGSRSGLEGYKRDLIYERNRIETIDTAHP